MHLGIEGIDGTGKSTLVKALIKALKSQKKKVFHTSEPGNKNQKASMMLRKLVLDQKYSNDIDDMSREYLLAVTRKTQYNKTLPKLKKGCWVVQDRGWLSGLAYSMAKGFDYNFIDSLNESLIPNYKGMFDLIVYLNNNKNVEDSLNKAKEAKQEFKTGDTIELKGVDFQTKVRDNFCQLCDKLSGSYNIKKIDIYDGDRRLTTDELVEKILKLMRKKILMFMGNSGSGKSTLEINLNQLYPNIFSRVVSYTTREIDTVNRKEVEGVNYHFISKDECERMKKSREFVQLSSYGGNYYGSTYGSYKNKTPFTIVTIKPDMGKKLAQELTKKGYDVKFVLFDVSNETITKNLLNEGEKLENINKRLGRGNIVDEFNKCQLKADVVIDDSLLNENLPSYFYNLKEKFYE